MARNQRSPLDFEKFSELIDYYKDLERAEEVIETLSPAASSKKRAPKHDSDAGESPRKRRRGNDNNNNNNSGKGKCPHCGMRGHKADDCWELKKNAGNRPEGWKPCSQRQHAHALSSSRSSSEAMVLSLLPAPSRRSMDSTPRAKRRRRAAAAAAKSRPTVPWPCKTCRASSRASRNCV